jgi:hypothetical protein
MPPWDPPDRGPTTATEKTNVWATVKVKRLTPDPAVAHLAYVTAVGSGCARTVMRVG